MTQQETSATEGTDTSQNENQARQKHLRRMK